MTLNVGTETINNKKDCISEETEKNLQQLEACFRNNEIDIVHLIKIFPLHYSGYHNDPIFVRLVSLITGSTLSMSPGSIVAAVMKQYGLEIKCELSLSCPIRTIIEIVRVHS